ncbi:porphobilinogen synthase [Ichthyobacterium seriolicida]|uniref:Delta-aminolevulinic acid dehydratase n=1 Tax=Ichthyobacterium seriolicida TaxID=242600 RepID=A0A1J1E6R4_9FLAO|nr:porphobilinogen synthase [Ichthyobacterium seriolicida]BAV95030.1 delta-aminolevulinic acid dehydratase [Ichthyobacterium seriolicida]
MYPLIRGRRLRKSESVRDIVREVSIFPCDFVVPLFIRDGVGIKDSIPSMPDYYCQSLDFVEKEVKYLYSIGIRAVLLFVKVPDNLKSNDGAEALNPKGLMQRSISLIKDTVPDMLVMTDVALDPYSSFGHDGLVERGVILNDKTNDILAQMALSHAESGCDVVAPSDMMDGRISSIRNILEKEGYTDTIIMSYSVKYASSFYGPFRDVLDSSPSFGDKKTYQMDFYNGSREAIKETLMDIREGADIVMIKPAGSYLDIIKSIREEINVPIASYQVSGEYSMIKAAAKNKWIDEKKAALESLVAIKRAGADIIVSYFAKSIVENLR